MQAHYTATPITLDGRLDEPIWRTATAYAMNLGDDMAAKGATLQDGGEARFAWDDTHLYVGIRLDDGDIVAESDEDQAHHYQTGDVAEVFLKPENNTWYWELYATPHGRKSHFWFAGRGYVGLPSIAEYDMELDVAARIDGTLNNWRDRDTGWTAEMAIPIAELTRHGDAFGPGSQWRVLVARYNYSRYIDLRSAELSMTPKLHATDYHRHEDYGVLEFVR